MTEYCSKCGGTGEIFDTGQRCSCPIGAGDYESVTGSCMLLPEQYRGNLFNPDLLPSDLNDYFKVYMDELYTGVSSMKLRNVNILLAAPAKHGKTFLAYAAMEKLYRRGADVFPLYDILELRRIMQDSDNGKKSKELEELGVDVSTLYTSPYLFVKLTTETSFAMFDAIKLLLDRRLRRSGGVTILLSDLPWNYLAQADQKGTFRGLAGDGSFGTILNKSFVAKGGEKVE